MTVPWTAVEQLQPHHDIDSFRSGRESVDTWLREKARHTANVATYVCVDDQGVVLAYFALTGISVGTESFSSALRKGTRGDTAAVLLAQMGLHVSLQRAGHGANLFRRAAIEAKRCHAICRVQFLVLDAADEDLVEWYKKLGMKQLQESWRLVARLDKLGPSN